MRIQSYFTALLVLAFTNISSAEPRSEEGGLVQSTIINCISIILGSPTSQAGTAVYLSYDWEGGKFPKIGETVLLGITILNMGGHCSIPASLTTLSLPSSLTVLNDDDGKPFNFCYQSTDKIYTQGDKCVGLRATPQGLSIESPSVTDSTSKWFAQPLMMKEGAFYRYLIPLVVTAPTNGLEYITARVQVADGNSSPTLVSQIGIYVEPTTTTTTTTEVTTTSTTIGNTPSAKPTPIDPLSAKAQASAHTFASKIRKAGSGESLSALKKNALKLVKNANALQKKNNGKFKQKLSKTAALLARVSRASNVKKAKAVFTKAADDLEAFAASL